MTIHYLLLDGARFAEEIRPALAASWRQRSFAPSRGLCAELLPAAQAFQDRYGTGGCESLLSLVHGGLRFDRRFWRTLVGEVLWFAAVEIPEVQTSPETLCCLLGGKRAAGREEFPPIEQALFGARDLVFGGGYYCCEQAGYNDRPDVTRLSAYLAGIDPSGWSSAELCSLPDLADEPDREEELRFVQEWFPVFQGLYRRAEEQGQVIVCEVL